MKEKELGDATTKLEQVLNKTRNIEIKTSELEKDRSKLTVEILGLEVRQRELVDNHEKEIRELREAAQKERDYIMAEKARLEKGLIKVKTYSQTLIIAALTAHLQRFSADIFQIQLDSICSPKKRDLDLRRNVLSYVERHTPEAKGEAEKTAYDILKQYALSKIKPGVQEYAKILSIHFIFQYKTYGQQAINALERQ